MAALSRITYLGSIRTCKKYGQEVPEYLPAEWLPNRWGQDWTAMVNVEGLDIDPVLKHMMPNGLLNKEKHFG